MESMETVVKNFLRRTNFQKCSHMVYDAKPIAKPNNTFGARSSQLLMELRTLRGNVRNACADVIQVQ
jgi:hypothetical protein